MEEDDKSFWFDAVKDVHPIKKSVNINIKPKFSEIKVNSHPQYAIKQEFTTYSKNIEDLEFGGIDKSTLRKFKREEFPLEAVLDLHGMTEDEAFSAVDDFVPSCYVQGKRCVLIITGKGLSVHEDENFFANKGVLRQRVPQWLNMSRLRGLILIYKNPTPRLGGSGALYILLKRNKDLK